MELKVRERNGYLVIREQENECEKRKTMEKREKDRQASRDK